MRVLTFVDIGRLEWREAPDPSLEGPLDALVRPIAAAPCDLDRSILSGRAPIPGPFALGHECVAEVVSVSEGVRVIRPGDVVSVPWHLSCGECDRCRRGLTASCLAFPPRAMFGTPIGGHHGGFFSDLVRVPRADAMLVPLPAGLDPAAVASASDNLTDAFTAASRALASHPGARVFVSGGAGSIGIYAVQAALALGASGVDYADKSEARLALAERVGASIVRRPDHPKGEYEVVLEASGIPDELARSIRSLAPGGVCASLGIYFLDTPLPMLSMYEKDVTFFTGRPSVGPNIARVLALAAEGRLKPELVTAKVYGWDDLVVGLASKDIKPVFTRPRTTQSPESRRGPS